MKIINVKVIPKSSKTEIIPFEDRYIVRVKAPAVSGKANKAVIEALAAYFKVKKTSIRLVKGAKARNKTIEIETDDES